MNVSVIVPAYNAELYLEESIDSVLSQTYKNFEIIIVNDGSTDRTGDIIKKYQAKYNNIKMIDQKNQGVAQARKRGLEAAGGEYIYFLDSDDVLVRDALEKMCERSESVKADLVIANFDYIANNIPTEQHILDEVLDQDRIDKYNYHLLWSYALSNKLFKKELIQRYDLKFPNITYSEDGVFLLSYVYHCSIIAGLDKIVYHYRKSFEKGHDAATGIPSVTKLQDMMKAHELIRASAHASFMKDRENTTAEAAEKLRNLEKQYMEDIDRREVHFLIEQFYSKLWVSDPEVIRIASEALSKRLAMMNSSNVCGLMSKYPEYNLFCLRDNYEEVFENAIFIIALYGDLFKQDMFLKVLDSLISQNFVSFRILAPLHMREIVEKEELSTGNIIYIDEENESVFFYKVLEYACTSKAEYIVFNNSGAYYMKYALKKVYRSFCQRECDFIIEQLYHDYYRCTIPDYAVSKAFRSQEYFIRYHSDIQFPDTMGCLFFRISFLRNFDFEKTVPLDHYMKSFCRKGIYRLYDRQMVRKIDMADDCCGYHGGNHCPGSNIKGAIEYADLNMPELLRNPAECRLKMLPWPERDRNDRIIRYFIQKFNKAPVKNKVLFLSTRATGKLDLNAEMLYREVKGKKTICAKTGKHELKTQLHMIWEIMTSKVIITDDYNRYLRYIPLKKKQKVIQIWHACGAFKMFGRRGTPLSPKVEAATHVQYNLVCVSGPEVKEIYADAFDIDIEKIKSVGVPRTDIYFDDSYIEGIRKRILKKYPDLKEKYIMIYAPTFRDYNGSREIFKPDIDFDRLSSILPENVVFIICPHPAMTAAVIEHSYHNIMEIRDISTNEMMLVSDMLITDYSSVIFEYALLRKPIVFYCSDIDMYDRGFYLRYPEDLPGEVFTLQDRFLEFLADQNRYRTSCKSEQFIRKYMSACDGNSSRRIADIIEDYMKKGDNG
ncbi:MAG: CDP-glycerol glycerophosphotransferase family protein [Eubacterium sp.]|nr:CDP-glycerol glycerophosphotransferase family protein [Eubacterium sp.]